MGSCLKSRLGVLVVDRHWTGNDAYVDSGVKYLLKVRCCEIESEACTDRFSLNWIPPAYRDEIDLLLTLNQVRKM
jgi:hypothetical protein